MENYLPYKLSIEKLSRCARMAIETTKESGLTEATLDSSFTDLTSLNTDFTKALQRNRYGNFNDSVTAAAEKCYKAHMGLRNYLRTTTQSLDSNVSNAATTLRDRVFPIGRGITTRNIVNNSTKLFRITEELGKEEHAQNIGITKLTDYIQSLDESAHNLEEVCRQKGNEKVSILKTSSATGMRKPLVLALNVFCNWVNAKSLTTKEAEWTLLLHQLQERFKSVKTTTSTKAATTDSATETTNPEQPVA